MSIMTPKSIAGLDVLWRDGTAKRCLVMLHGIGSNAHAFERLCALLPEDWALLSWNAPGYGESEPLPMHRPTAADYAARLRDLIDALALPRFTLLGHSLGTLIATEFAARYPNKVAELILLSCAQGYGMASDAALPGKAAARLDGLERLGPRAFAEARAPKLLHDPTARPDLAGEAVTAMAAIDPAGYAQAVYMLAAGNLSERASAVQASSLVMVGADDTITPPDQSRKVHAALVAAGGDGTADYLEIAATGHLLHKEKPDVVAAEIIRFLSAEEPVLQGAAR